MDFLFFQRSWHARFSSLIFSSHFSLFFARWTSSRAQTFRPTTDPWYSRRLRRRRRRDAFPSLFGEFECRSLHKGILRSPHTEYYLNADGGDVVGSMGRRAIVPRGEDFSRFEPARKFFTSRLDFDHLLIVINRWSSVCAPSCWELFISCIDDVFRSRPLFLRRFGFRIFDFPKIVLYIIKVFINRKLMLVASKITNFQFFFTREVASGLGCVFINFPVFWKRQPALNCLTVGCLLKWLRIHRILVYLYKIRVDPK
jgi:hypothetical protein